ncbi:MAG: hypothetical protein WAQ08_10085 [Aquabacterium sp.]|jgi:hypothetical protein|uniref:hypothetical protein n=1 Tax=Aquabacterium sp. TaxID=1872578 RepID=UPI003BB2171A
MAAPETPPSPQQERERALQRRQTLNIVRPHGQDQAQWGIALSGGGIRSATFCLGALQALAHNPGPLASSGGTAAPAASPTLPSTPPATPSPAQTTSGPQAAPGTSTTKPLRAGTIDPLIAQFDYLSTVSGGGYIGSFFTSLFVPGRLSGQGPGEDPAAVTWRAYRALQDEPPARIHTTTRYDPAHPGRAALAWLRDNGRYLAPHGTGDVLYGMGVALRNWMATHYATGTVILMGLALLLSIRLALALTFPAYAQWEAELCAAAGSQGRGIWWSPTWALCAVVVVVALGPVGMAFWFSHPARDKGRRTAQDGDPIAMKPLPVTWASFLGGVIAVGLILVGGLGVGWSEGPRWPLGLIVSGCGVFAAWSVVIYGLSAIALRDSSIARQRVILTRCLAQSLMVLIVIGLLAAIETLAQTLWLGWHVQSGVIGGAVLGGLVWLLRTGLLKLADKSTVALVERLPLDLIAGLLGIALWIAVASAFGMLLLQVVWFGFEPYTVAASLSDPTTVHALLCYALGTLLVAMGLALVVGRFPGFLNLSTFQSLYAARLTRAYLGATNHRRFCADARSRHRDVAEPIEGDSLDTIAPYANPLAPVHFVNVCVNQTVSPGEQLVQRDRKGKPLVIAPKGYYLDQGAYAMRMHGPRNELSYPLNFGEWIGVSGAAISTGLGRNSGLGFSLIIGFANLRLGRWWPGVPEHKGMRSHWVRRVFTTQTYLIDEIRGLFYGSHRAYQYLSDGGHFDNTGIYELLKPERDRGVRLIVLCDCGQDVDNDFRDLANLIRLARIDHGLEIRVNEEAADDPLLSERFGRPADFRRRPDGSLPPAGTRCAILLDVLATSRDAAQPPRPPGSVVARIVLLKPVLISDVPVDLSHYQSTHDGFPQQTTGDQFFDEAQWESYRQLGLHIGLRVFPQDPASGYGQAFWRVCLQGLPG